MHAHTRVHKHTDIHTEICTQCKRKRRKDTKEKFWLSVTFSLNLSLYVIHTITRDHAHILNVIKQKCWGILTGQKLTGHSMAETDVSYNPRVKEKLRPTSLCVLLVVDDTHS